MSSHIARTEVDHITVRKIHERTHMEADREKSTLTMLGCLSYERAISITIYHADDIKYN